MKLHIDQLTPGDYIVHPEHGEVVQVVLLSIDRHGDAVVDFSDNCLVCFPDDRVEQVGSLRTGASPRPESALF